MVIRDSSVDKPSMCLAGKRGRKAGRRGGIKERETSKDGSDRAEEDRNETGVTNLPPSIFVSSADRPCIPTPGPSASVLPSSGDVTVGYIRSSKFFLQHG